MNDKFLISFYHDFAFKLMLGVLLQIDGLSCILEMAYGEAFFGGALVPVLLNAWDNYLTLSYFLLVDL